MKHMLVSRSAAAALFLITSGIAGLLETTAADAQGGASGQLQYNNSGSFGGVSGASSDGTAVMVASGDLQLLGSTSGTSILNAPATGGGTATLPIGTGSIAYTLSGTITYTIAASGGTFTSIPAALSFLATQTIAPDTLIFLQLADGTYTYTQPITIMSKYGGQLVIEGTNVYGYSLSSIQSSSGSAGSWSLVLNVSSVANTTTNDYACIYNVSGGTNPGYAAGCFPITNVDAVNTRITVSTTSHASAAPSGAVTGSVGIVKSIVKFNGANGFQIYNDGAMLELDNLVVAGDGSGAYTGFNIDDNDRGYTGALVGFVGFGGSNINIDHSAEFNSQGVVISSGSVSGQGFAMRNGAGFNATTGSATVSTGNGSDGVLVNSNGYFTLASTGNVFSGNGNSGLHASGGGFISAENSIVTGNLGWGTNADSAGKTDVLSSTGGNNASGDWFGQFTLGTSNNTAADRTSFYAGNGAGSSNTNSSSAKNTELGGLAAEYATTAANITAIGYQTCGTVAATALTAGSITCVGTDAGASLQGANPAQDTFTGAFAGEYVTTADATTADGFKACLGNSGTPVTGNGNTCIGASSYVNIQGGAQNDTGLGTGSGKDCTTCATTLALGPGALNDSTTFTGARVAVISLVSNTTHPCPSSTSASDEFDLCGTSSAVSPNIRCKLASGSQNCDFPAGGLKETGITTDATHTTATVCEDTTTNQFYFGSGANGICAGTSSQRFKQELAAYTASDLGGIEQLDLYTFRYRKGYGDSGAKRQLGVMAEDVIKVFPDCVGLDAKAKPNSVDTVCILYHALKAEQELGRRVTALEKHA